MNKKDVFIIGLMSGTSLDGVDLVYVRFDSNAYRDFQILYSVTLSYTKEWKQILQNAMHYNEQDLESLSDSYGEHLSMLVNNFVKKYKIEKIDFIASHGHTILHQPADGITLQIGNGQIIADITQQKVICDFRTQDVKLGGQGAPLVPIGDELLFSDFDFCINLGGFSNISFNNKGKRIAFDVCPVNIVLNKYVQKLGLEFDDKGKIASKGQIHPKLLSELNEIEFYRKEHPKSLGLEWVQKEIFPMIDKFNLDIPDILRTFTEHIAIQISKVITPEAIVLFTGGGFFNSFLMERISVLSEIKIVQVSNEMINYKEALIFAFLGLLKTKDAVNCLKSVTGAEKNHSSGAVFYPTK